ncbi:MAG: SDR family NAD(P)-dependent oxidoreductase, partial [Acidobacteriaceae bacterium]
SEQDLEPLLSADVSVAVVNSPSQTVASGPEDAIAALEDTLRNKKIECRRLRTSHAFHSPMMEPLVDGFVQRVAQIKLHPPRLRYLSNVTGTWITDAQATDPRYWGSHLRNTVRFAECGRNLLRESNDVLLEVGPGETLLSLLRAQLEPRSTRPAIASMRHPLTKQNDHEVWLAAAARLWLSNVRLDWNGLHRGERRLRVSLPTYPFERQRYWVEPKKLQAASLALTADKQADIADWFYIPSWRRTATELLPHAKRGAGDTCLVFTGDTPLNSALIAGLGAQAHVIQIRAAGQFHRVSPELYDICPGRREDYIALLKDLQEGGRWPDRIVHAWIADAGDSADLDAVIERGILSIMFLVQATGEFSVSRPIELNILGNRGYSVFGEPVSSPAPSALYAFCSVVALESPNIVSRIIDVDLAADPAVVSAQLIAELASVAANETVAYRGTTRWLRHYDPVRLGEPHSVEDAGQHRPEISLRPGGTYLITGGTGGVGLVLAQHLARTANAQIVLTSRTPMPPHAEWPALLEQPDTPAGVKRKIQEICTIEKTGGKVLLLEADVANETGMRQVLASIRAQYGRIHGIIHAAGTSGARMVATKPREEALAVLSPKVQGTRWLRESIAADKPDFVLLCSSISAVIPSFGLADYAAANAYLDGFAAVHDNPSGTRVLSANWDTWREVGMAVDTAMPTEMEHLRESRLKHGILSAEAEDVFDRLLRSPMPQTVVSTRNFNFLERQTAATIATLRETLQPSVSGSALGIHTRPASMEDFAAAGDEIEKFVIAVWEELLGTQPIGINDNFFELGGHSLLGTQVLARVRDRFQVSLSLRTIFEAATPAELAQHIRVAYWASNSPAEGSTLEREEIEI